MKNRHVCDRNPHDLYLREIGKISRLKSHGFWYCGEKKAGKISYSEYQKYIHQESLYIIVRVYPNKAEVLRQGWSWNRKKGKYERVYMDAIVECKVRWKEIYRACIKAERETVKPRPRQWWESKKNDGSE
jgi:hypothetical protein